jgi:hypothetical protein
MFGFFMRKITLEEQLKNLAHAGTTLRQGITEVAIFSIDKIKVPLVF